MRRDGERDDEIDELTNTLLRSLRDDAAPTHANRATLAALGIGAATTAAAGSASALAGAARVGALAITKAVAGGALAGAVVVGTSSYIQHRSAAPSVAIHVSATSAPFSGAPAKIEPVAPLRRENADEENATADEVSPRSDRVAPVPARPREERLGATTSPSAAPPSGDPAPAAASDFAPAAKPSALAREIALLDESRAALARNDPRGALGFLDRYAREFEPGNLWPESVVLRIDALLRQGEVHPAQVLADEFERARPNDSHLSRIRSLLSAAGVSRAERPFGR